MAKFNTPKKNLDIRKAAKENGVHLWELADRFGVSEPTFCRWMRDEFSDEKKEMARFYIEEIANRKWNEQVTREVNGEQ